MFVDIVVEEAQDNVLCEVLSQSFDDGVIDISYRSLLPHQVVSLGLFLSRSHRKWEGLNLGSCHIGDHGMNILHQYLCGDKANKQAITKIDLSDNDLTGASSHLIADIINHLQAHTLLLEDNITNVRDISTSLTMLDLSGNQLKLTEMIQTAQLLRTNTNLQQLRMCNNAKRFCSEVEFIVDVTLSVNPKLSELIVDHTNVRPRNSNYSKILTTAGENFSLQHLYIANEFPLYLSHSEIFKESFVVHLDGGKKFKKVEELCPFDHVKIFTHYVDHRGGVYYYKDHDVTLFIPPDAILQNDYVEIKVSSSFYAQFHIPQNYNRISSYVWVAANYDFKVPVYLIMSHFIDTKSVRNIETLSVFEACKLHSNRTSDETLLMKKLPASVFDSALKYCIISTDHFCTYCLAELQNSSTEDCHSNKLFLALYYNYCEQAKLHRGVTYIAEICCFYFNNNCFKVGKISI